LARRFSRRFPGAAQLIAFEHWPRLEASRRCIVTKGSNNRYLAPGLQPLSAEWKRTVHAAKVIDDLMQEPTAGHYVYRKTNHAPWLVGWLLKHRPAELEDLEQIVRKALDVKDPS
jgi:hypothetical protein